MGKINILDEKTINKIAAGEVIEKPASIVKELVENSIDSMASEIIVEVKNGGISYINVTDNGCGIDYDDLEKAFLRHATSKIKNDKDLSNILTLGFRGEALSSIAAISKVVMISKQSKDTFGSKIVIEGGKILNKEYCGAKDGTSITINDVFFNTPARLKFLKSPSREGMYITEVMQNLAMSHIDISFKYKLNDKLIFATKGDGDLKSVLLSIYGRDIIKNIIELHYVGNVATVKGFVGNSNIAKGSRSSQSIFVNKRYVKNKTITAAVEAAYKSMITINKFPFFVVDLYVNPEFTDVNVHPAKSEIKFQNDNEIFKDVYNAVKKALLSSNSIIDIEDKDDKIIKEIPKINYKQQKINIDSYIKENKREEIKYEDNIDKDVCENISLETKEEKLIENNINKNIDANFNKENNNAIYNNLKEPKFKPLAIIGQLHFTYIIAEGEDELYIIDQHAAHERIFYEKYINEFNNTGIFSQSLAVPVVIDLSISEKQLIFDNIDLFNKFGFEIEDFGGNSISIRGIPVIYGNPDTKELFTEILSILNNIENEKINIIDKTLYTLACKSAIKAGDKLNYKEMFELVDKLRYCDNPFNCPHGRPTIIKMTINDLEKKFKRIQ